MNANSPLGSYKVIHITGASGSGTTTLGRAISRRCGHLHLDSDDFIWEQTDPMFTLMRERTARQAMMWEAIEASDNCVISGSLVGWGDVFIPLFELVIYVSTPTEMRLKRLAEREYQRFGERILHGGDMAAEHQSFMEWAAQYDEGGLDIRSARTHAQWLAALDCPIVRLDGSVDIDESIAILEGIVQ